MPFVRLFSLLFSSQPLHGHLPSPEVLIVLLIARLLQPRRLVTSHWHCFLESSPDFTGRLFRLYQTFAIASLPFLSGVITTSPTLSSELCRLGCKRERIFVLPCCLSSTQETAALSLPGPNRVHSSLFVVLFIGRLDSYKRVDWLLEALAELPMPWHLDIVGDGPKRHLFENQAKMFFGTNNSICFHGRLDEDAKLNCLAHANVLVLPSDRCNEAFGIVQLEAMAAGFLLWLFSVFVPAWGGLVNLVSSLGPNNRQDLPMPYVICNLVLLAPALTSPCERYRSLFQRSVCCSICSGCTS